MKMYKVFLPVAAVLLLAGEACAQADSEERQREMVEREMQMAEREKKMAERLRAAEQQMEVAAREIAEITRERLPEMYRIERRFEFADKPRIGITIDGSKDSGPVDGVAVEGVSPGSAADDVGLRAGDVIVSVNGESMSAKSSEAANSQLFDLMRGVKDGDVLDIDYMRGGNKGTLELTPRVVEMHAFSWMPEVGQAPTHGFGGTVIAPESMQSFQMKLGFPFAGGAWGSMELVELSDGLGKYFGVDKGLLVIRAPVSDGIDLKDGDVIQSIDGREPKDVRHAMRILGSYKDGESLQLEIMRDKKKRQVEVQVPADHHGWLFEPLPAKPARAPMPPSPPAETVAT